MVTMSSKEKPNDYSGFEINCPTSRVRIIPLQTNITEKEFDLMQCDKLNTNNT